MRAMPASPGPDNRADGGTWGSGLVDDRGRPTRHAPHPAFVITGILALAFAVLVTWPQIVGLHRTFGFTQLIAFRAELALGFGALALLTVLIAVLARRRLVLRSIAVGLALGLVAAALGNGTVLASRGWADPSSADAATGDLVVASWNTQYSAVPPEQIARLVEETGADIVSLPETDEQTATAAAEALASSGHPMTVHSTGGSVPTSLLIAEDLGTYEHDASAGSGLWRPATGDGPVIVAAHPLPPIRSTMTDWREGTAWATSFCSEPGVIVAGDLNATLDHLSGMLGQCRDAAAEADVAALGTWPTSALRSLAAPIDHVLVGSAWDVTGFQVSTGFDDAGSDHRPVVATLTQRT
jgi:endonuclease/exonuclease/phosphatase (EEP) superfamily protein YafD